MIRKLSILFFLSGLCFRLFSQADFSERSRVAVGVGGNLAFKTVGGYHGRAYLQFSPKWKMVFDGESIFSYNSLTKKTSDHLSFNFNVLHARKRYSDYDVLYFFEGINAEVWDRNRAPKMPFRSFVVSESATDTINLVTSLNVGVGFEKPIGPIGFYAELKVGIGAYDWLMISFGIKTNIKRIFKGPKKRYDLDLEESED